MSVNDTWIYLNLHLHESMTSLTGCHSTLFCTSSIGQKADVPTEWASAVPALPRPLPALPFMRHLSEQHLESAACLWKLWGGALYGVSWVGSCTECTDHALYLTLFVYHLGRVSTWSGFSLTTSCPPAKLRSTGISLPRYHCSRCSLCQLQTVQVVHRPCPRRKTQEQ